MINKLPGSSLRAAELVRGAKKTHDARTELEALVASVAPELPSGFVKAKGETLEAVDIDRDFITNAGTQLKVVERRLDQCIRSLRRESSGRDSPTAMRVLANDALRLVIEVVGWRRLGDLATAQLDAPSGSGMLAIRQPGAAGMAHVQQLHRLLTSTEPQRHRALAATAFDKTDKVVAGKKDHKPNLTETEADALVDILGSSDPGRRDIIRERLRGGESPADIRAMLMERMIPVSLAVAEKGEDAKADAGGLMFDLGSNTFVQKDLSWAYDVSVGQLFDYVVDGICNGREELATRMIVAATDPTTGDFVGATEEQIRSFVDDLAAAASVGHAGVDELLATPFTMCFSTTDFGSKPVSADWELPRRATADLFHAMTDATFRSELSSVAGDARTAQEKRKTDILAPLADLLAKYDGKPRRHKRAHAALINLGLAQQSIQNMGREGGVLPRSRTLLDPSTIAEQYGDEHVKLRFLFTDDYEMFVISDEMFQEVVEKYHFPPNHELLSYNKRIAGSGYVTVDKGVIVGLEDDIEMCPGKMPANLAPAYEVLEARGFKLDAERIAASSRVVDWEGFTEQLDKPRDELPAAPTGTPEEIHEFLESCPHGDRPALVAVAILAELEKNRAGGAQEPVARSKTEDFVKSILEGFQIINVAARDFRSGDLPSNMNEFMEMKIDDVLAPYLVRKAAGQ